MDLSSLTPPIPEAVRTRVPAPPSALPDRQSVRVPDLGVSGDDGSNDAPLAERASRWLTLLSLAGLAVAAIGTLGRLLLDRRRSDVAEAPPGPPLSDEGASTEAPTTAVDLTGPEEPGESTPDDRSSEPDAEASESTTQTGRVSDETESSGPTDRSDVQSSGNELDSPLAERSAVDGAASSAETDATDERSEEAGAVPGSVSAPAEKLSGSAGTAADRQPRESEPPRIAPLVGMAALVALRLFVEKRRERSGRDVEDRRTDQ